MRRWRTTTGVICGFLTLLAAPAHTEASVFDPVTRGPDMLHPSVAADPGYLAAAEPVARAVAKEYGIPASVTAAQSILESGWGGSELAVEQRNYFGFKCVAGRPGPIASGCHEYPTTECTPLCHPATAAFRVYSTMRDSFRDYGRLISTSQYYAHALPFVDDAKRFITEVAKSYATDPKYAGKVIRLMDQHDLYRLDSQE